MIKQIFLAGRSLEARFKNLEVIANNLANINTTGYKKTIPFSEVIMKETDEIRARQIIDKQQGEAEQTNNPLDAAIFGEGFFTLQTERGIELTRNGKFNISNDGFLINEKGDKVLGKNGLINFNLFTLDKDQTVTISPEGRIKLGETEVDSLLISKLENYEKNSLTDGSYFISDSGYYNPADESEFRVAQGYLEMSNVNAVDEMTAMIQLNRDFESTYKIVNFLDESLEKANQVGKV